jgi:hypothetical protein
MITKLSPHCDHQRDKRIQNSRSRHRKHEDGLAAFQYRNLMAQHDRSQQQRSAVSLIASGDQGRRAWLQAIAERPNHQ